jgi:hypothetical protein
VSGVRLVSRSFRVGGFRGKSYEGEEQMGLLIRERKVSLGRDLRRVRMGAQVSRLLSLRRSDSSKVYGTSWGRWVGWMEQLRSYNQRSCLR